MAIILKQLECIPSPIHLVGIGMAFPGPFDYKNGIPLMQNINKYDSLYGISIGSEILNRLRTYEAFTAAASPTCSIKFKNDASLYALGETVLHPALMKSKVLCLYIGTGLGSAFLEDGKLITNHFDVPQNGWIYDTPFLESIIDDYISARDILALHKSLHQITVSDVKIIVALALQGDTAALKTFECFGTYLAKAITYFLGTFKPDTLVIGGQIAKSFSLFEEAFNNHLHKMHLSPTICLSTDSSLSTLMSVNRLFE